MPSVILKEQTFDRLSKGADLAHRYLPTFDRLRRLIPDLDRRVWFKCIPDSSSVQAAPANGVVEMVGVDLEGDQPVIRYVRPSGANLTKTAILWGQAIPAGSVSGAEGMCTLESAFAAYDTGDTPAFDENWGTDTDSYLLKQGNTGYRIIGAQHAGIVYVRGLANVDEKLAVASGENAGYWSDIHGEFNASATYQAGEDLLVHSENVGTTPDKNLRAYVDLSEVPSWGGIGSFYLGINDGSVTFFEASGDTDELVAVASGQTAGYLSAVLVDRSHSGMELGIDLTVSGATMDAKSDLSLLSSYSGTDVQFLKHDTGGGLFWGDVDSADEKVAVASGQTADYLENVLIDLPHGGMIVGISWDTTGADMTGEADLSLLSDYNGSTDQFLRHDDSGNLYWGEGGGETDTDELVAVASGQTPGYLSAVLVDASISGGVLGVNFTVSGATMNGTIDLTSLSGWTTSGLIALVVNGGSLQWMAIDECPE